MFGEDVTSSIAYALFLQVIGLLIMMYGTSIRTQAKKLHHKEVKSKSTKKGLAIEVIGFVFLGLSLVQIANSIYQFSKMK